jgi:hypothetical protein
VGRVPLPAALRVNEDFIGIGDLEEPGRRVRVTGVGIGMVLTGLLAVSDLDLPGGGVAGRPSKS